MFKWLKQCRVQVWEAWTPMTRCSRRSWRRCWARWGRATQTSRPRRGSPASWSSSPAWASSTGSRTSRVRKQLSKFSCINSCQAKNLLKFLRCSHWVNNLNDLFSFQLWFRRWVTWMQQWRGYSQGLFRVRASRELGTCYYGGRHKDTDYIYYSSDILQLQQHCFKWVFVF